jgi:hypothetical protein
MATSQGGHVLPEPPQAAVVRRLPTGLTWPTTWLTTWLTWLTWLGFVHGKSTATELCPLEPLNGGSGLAAIWHLYETKAARAPSFTVGNDMAVFHGPILLKELTKVLIRSGERKVTNKDVHAGFLMDQC